MNESMNMRMRDLQPAMTMIRAQEECNLLGLGYGNNFREDEALAFTTNPPHQQGPCQGARIGYRLALPPTANKAQCLMPPPGANKDLPRRNEAEWLKLPARMPIRTYNRDFDVPRSKAQLGLFEQEFEQGPCDCPISSWGTVRMHQLLWAHPRVRGQGLA